MADLDSLVKPGTRIGSYTAVRPCARHREAWLATGPDGGWVVLVLPTVDRGRAAFERHLDPQQVVAAARAQAQIHHPNVVRVLEVLELEGQPVIVNDTVGPALWAVLKQRPPTDAFADAVVRDLAAGLAAVHDAGSVHGNLRAATVALAVDGERVVARIDAVGLEDGPRLVPECIRGDAPDARSDVFLLGVVACTALTAAHPFKGVTDEEIAYSTLAGRYGPLREIPDPMAAAIDGALRVDPRHRTANVRDFLALWTEGRPEPTPDPALLAAVRKYGATSG